MTVICQEDSFLANAFITGLGHAPAVNLSPRGCFYKTVGVRCVMCVKNVFSPLPGTE